MFFDEKEMEEFFSKTVTIGERNRIIRTMKNVKSSFAAQGLFASMGAIQKDKEPLIMANFRKCASDSVAVINDLLDELHKNGFITKYESRKSGFKRNVIKLSTFREFIEFHYNGKKRKSVYE